MKDNNILLFIIVVYDFGQKYCSLMKCKLGKIDEKKIRDALKSIGKIGGF